MSSSTATVHNHRQIYNTLSKCTLKPCLYDFMGPEEPL